MQEREWVELSEVEVQQQARATAAAELRERAQRLRFDAKKHKSGGHVKSYRKLKKEAQTLEGEARALEREGGGMLDSLMAVLKGDDGAQTRP